MKQKDGTTASERSRMMKPKSIKIPTTKFGINLDFEKSRDFLEYIDLVFKEIYRSLLQYVLIKIAF